MLLAHQVPNVRARWAAPAVVLVLAALSLVAPGDPSAAAAEPTETALPSVSECVDGHQIGYEQVTAYSTLTAVRVDVRPCDPEATAPDQGYVSLELDNGEVLARGYSGPGNISGTWHYSARGYDIELAERDTTYPLAIRWAPLNGDEVVIRSTIVSTHANTTVDSPDFLPYAVFRGDGTADVHVTVRQGAGEPFYIGSGRAPERTGTVVLRADGVEVSRGDLNDDYSQTTLVVPRAVDGQRLTVEYLGDDFYFGSSAELVAVDYRHTPSIEILPQDGHGSVALDVTFRTESHLNFTAGTARVLSDRQPLTTIDYTAHRGTFMLYTMARITGGRHTITVQFLGDDDHKPTEASVVVNIAAIDVWLDTTRPGAATTVEAGAPFTLTYDAADMFRRPSTFPVRLQYRLRGTTTWRTLSTTTARTGTVSFTVSQNVSRYYRVTSPATPSYRSGVSDHVLVEVRRHTTLTRAKVTRSKVVLRATARTTGTVVVQERVNGAWRNRASLRPTAAAGSTGAVTYSVSRTSRNRVFRVVVRRDSEGTRAVSTSVTVPRR